VLRILLDIRWAIAIAMAMSAAAFVLGLIACNRVDSRDRPFTGWNGRVFQRPVQRTSSIDVPTSSPSGGIGAVTGSSAPEILTVDEFLAAVDKGQNLTAEEELIQRILDDLKALRQDGDDGLIIWRPFGPGFQPLSDFPPVYSPSGEFYYGSDCPPVCPPSGEFDYGSDCPPLCPPSGEYDYL
jgi:hypothetical protein